MVCRLRSFLGFIRDHPWSLINHSGGESAFRRRESRPGSPVPLRNSPEKAFFNLVGPLGRISQRSQMSTAKYNLFIAKLR